MNDHDIVTRLRRDCMSLIADEAADEIERLRAERDAARQEICTMLMAEDATCSERGYAKARGWDCYEEDTNAQGQ